MGLRLKRSVTEDKMLILMMEIRHIRSLQKALFSARVALRQARCAILASRDKEITDFEAWLLDTEDFLIRKQAEFLEHREELEDEIKSIRR